MNSSDVSRDLFLAVVRPTVLPKQTSDVLLYAKDKIVCFIFSKINWDKPGRLHRWGPVDMDTMHANVDAPGFGPGLDKDQHSENKF